MISIVIPSLPGYDELNEKTAREFKETSDQDVEVVISVGDRPFAQNVNVGLQRSKGELIVVSNNDVTPLPSWDRVLDIHPGIYSFTPRVDCGWCFGFPRKVFDEVGFLDEQLVNSYEDYDWFIRAALKGYTRFPAKQTYALHRGGHTINSIWGTVQEKRSVRLETCHRNRQYMINKWPGVNVDAVPELYWNTHAVEIMNEWKKQRQSIQN